MKEGWNGFSVLHTAAARVGALDLGFVPGEGGLDAPARWREGGVDVLFNLGADEIEIAPGRLRGLSGHARRPRRASRRRHPARARPTPRSPAPTSTPKGACRWRTAPPSRRATRARTGRSLRALSDVLGHRLPFDSLAALRQTLYRRHPAFRRARSDRCERRCGGCPGARRARRRHRARAVRQPDRRLLPDEPDRPRLRRHGRVLGAGPRREARSGGVRGRIMNLGRHPPLAR